MPPDRSRILQITKDPYKFDFLMLGTDSQERDLERGLIEHLRQFLLELCVGFAFVGSQYRLPVGSEEFFLDLLFYHLKLRAYVVVDLKMEAFRPEFLGKMNFYLSAVNDLLRHQDDQPSIGLILCKTRDRVEWSKRPSWRPPAPGGPDCAGQTRGTLFLDEVDTLPLKAQIDLLRVLQDERFRRVGSTAEQEADGRVVAATNAAVKDLVRSAQFRADLYHRLCIFTVKLPPLRERKEDILPLAMHFLGKHAVPADAQFLVGRAGCIEIVRAREDEDLQRQSAEQPHYCPAGASIAP